MGGQMSGMCFLTKEMQQLAIFCLLYFSKIVIAMFAWTMHGQLLINGVAQY